MKTTSKVLLGSLLFLTLATPALAYGHGWHKKYKKASWGEWTVKKPSQLTSATPKPATTTPSVVVSTPPVVVVVPPVTAPTQSGETRFSAYITGYSYWDNTPAASAEISHPVIHQKAGGTGTFADPVTLAVGHSIIGGKDILDYPAGTKFYVPNLRKYFIVEDTCGDGNNPQAGPCHTGYQGNVWLDVYVDGKTASRSTSDNCMNSITKVQLVIKNPASNYKVVAGDMSANCAQYGDTVVTN